MHNQFNLTPVKHPVPKGYSYYALGKRAECLTRNLEKAKSFYWAAICSHDRPESALKDLASIMHQEGETIKAIDLLESHRHLFTDSGRVDNLLANLREKLAWTRHTALKCIKLTPVRQFDSAATIKRLFKDPSRIKSVEIRYQSHESYALLVFQSHSAARKTLKSFSMWRHYRVEWVNGETGAGELISQFGNREDSETLQFLLGKDLFDEIFAEEKCK